MGKQTHRVMCKEMPQRCAGTAPLADLVPVITSTGLITLECAQVLPAFCFQHSALLPFAFLVMGCENLIQDTLPRLAGGHLLVGLVGVLKILVPKTKQNQERVQGHIFKRREKVGFSDAVFHGYNF